MKYGDTLRQRSTPEWGHYNIDYDYLKDIIKHQTTSGTGKALSIPGQGGSSEKVFGSTFYKALKAQHDRVNLFIRSKSGEIERRLEHINKNLEQQLQERRASGDRLSARIVEKYAKIDADVAKAGEEIRSLSRFQVAQRTGFRKILKKYKRWTNDSDLERQFREQVTSNPTSFYQLDLGYLLTQYINVLGALRAPFDGLGESYPAIGADTSSPTVRISQASQGGCELDFDLALSLTPLGSNGNKATYWIHPDHIVEVEVLLLQHMSLITASSPPTTKDSSEARPILKRHGSSTSSDGVLGSEDGVGLLVLDHPESFAIRQNASSLGSDEETPGTLQVNAAGNARWTSSGDAVVALGLEEASSRAVLTAKLARKQLPSFLDTSAPLPIATSPGRQGREVSNTTKAASTNITAARQWLEGHKKVRPIVGICSKRTRFMGLRNNSAGGMWATLDKDVFMKSTVHKDLGTKEWLSAARTGSISFPHAILEIRREGAGSSSLIQALDHSHLVERVRGFSLQAQAVWACCKPSAMSAPIWTPLLDKDIRKLPPPTKRQRRQANSIASSSRSPPTTSASGASSSDGWTRSTTPRQGESSTISSPEFVEEAPPLRAFRKKRKAHADHGAHQAEPEAQRYWNEYDNPESEDEGYYIYVDPDAAITFPARELFEKWAAKIRKLFGVKEEWEEDSSLSTTESSDDETINETPVTPITPASHYGTFVAANSRRRQEGFLSGLFRKLRDPHRDFYALSRMRRHNIHECQSLLNEIEIRQHRAETIKQHLYTACLAMAIVIDVILGMMTITSRRKERGVVDSVVLFGTICNFLLGVIAVISMQTRKEKLGWIHQGVVYVVFTGNVVVDILYLVWVFRGF